MADQIDVDDLIRQLNKQVGTSNAVMERYSLAMEELGGLRLMLLEARESLRDHFEENSRWADNLSKRLDRLERYVILTKVGGAADALDIIETEVNQEHADRALREELTSQRELFTIYQRNVERAKLKIAKFGESTPLLNEVDDYEIQLVRITENIERIRGLLR